MELILSYSTKVHSDCSAMNTMFRQTAEQYTAMLMDGGCLQERNPPDSRSVTKGRCQPHRSPHPRHKPTSDSEV